jgi:glutamine synthetase
MKCPNLGNKIRHKEGYFPVAPADTQQDIRTEMCLTWKLGVKIEKQHHEVATAGQAEIDYRFNTLVTAADWMMIYKYVVKNVAKKHGKTACLHAQAALRRQRFRHAHPPVACGKRASRSLPARNTAA